MKTQKKRITFFKNGLRFLKTDSEKWIPFLRKRIPFFKKRVLFFKKRIPDSVFQKTDSVFWKRKTKTDGVFLKNRIAFFNNPKKKTNSVF